MNKPGRNLTRKPIPRTTTIRVEAVDPDLGRVFVADLDNGGIRVGALGSTRDFPAEHPSYTAACAISPGDFEDIFDAVTSLFAPK